MDLVHLERPGDRTTDEVGARPPGASQGQVSAERVPRWLAESHGGCFDGVGEVIDTGDRHDQMSTENGDLGSETGRGRWQVESFETLGGLGGVDVAEETERDVPRRFGHQTDVGTCVVDESPERFDGVGVRPDGDEQSGRHVASAGRGQPPRSRAI